MTGLNLRTLVRDTAHQVDEGVAALVTLWVLQPSVDYLPAWCAGVLASAAGLLLALSPRSLVQGRRFARSRGFGPIDGFLAWVRIKARHFYDFVALRRIVTGADDLGSWEISEVNADAVRRLREAGQSFIVATGHFAREAYVGLYARRILPHRITTVLAPPVRATGGHTLYIMIRLRGLRRAITRLRPHDSEIVVTGRRDRLRDRLIQRLRSPGQVVVSAVDAYWTRGSHVRSFAGDLSRPFAVGTAQIARLSQCPIVPCVPVLLGPRRVAIHWGPIVRPPAFHDVDADQRVTNLLLSFLETAVGLRPDQYVLPLNNEREWDAGAMRWRPARGAAMPEQTATAHRHSARRPELTCGTLGFDRT